MVRDEELEVLLGDVADAAACSTRLGAEAFAINTSPEAIQRYEAHLDRALDRAYRRLEVLQRARNNDLPPPERVDVTVTPA